jgi:hypothetical protein
MKPKNFILTNKQNLAQGKAVFEKKLFGLSAFRFGGEFWHSYNPLTYNDTLKVLKDNLVSILRKPIFISPMNWRPSWVFVMSIHPF